MGVFIGYLEVVLYLPHSRSLKDKRAVVRSVIEKTRRRFNVSASEVGELDKWQSSIVAFSCVSNSRKLIDSTFEGVINLIERLFPGTVESYHKQII